MVVCSANDHNFQADVIIVIEATAVNGAYINDLKTNYIIPSLEYFSQGNLDESNYLSESLNSFYGVVLYQAADCLPHLCTDTIGPFTSPLKVVSVIDKLELLGGKGESHANIAEGLATALQCFEELQTKRESSANVVKHCLLVCNSPPYAMPVMESQAFAGKTAEQLASFFLENNINLSIISPRKIPSLYKLFEKSGGDLTTLQHKNYAKDPRHLVLLKDYSLKERPISPPPGSVTSQQNPLSNTALPITSLPSPLAGNDSPIQGNTQNAQNLLNNTANPVVQNVVGQAPVYRPASAGLNTMPQHSQSMVTPGMVGIVNTRGPIMPGMVSNIMNGSTGYPHVQNMGAQRPPQRWGMPPQPGSQRPYIAPNQQNQQTQGSALIAQLTQPPSSIPTNNVGQFIQISSNSPLGQQGQQQQMKIGMNLPGQMQNALNQNQNPIPGVSSSMSQVSQPNQGVTSQAQNPAQPSQQQPGQIGSGRERHNIWQGLLEWIEKPKNAQDQQKITKHVPCQVSANSKDGEPELKADGWPPKLIMQLMPKQLIGSIGGAYLKNSKSVLFHPQPCEALESLTKVMGSGFAGCVHFTSIPNPQACDIKVLILLYTVEKRAFLGFIPNDQAAFVDRLRKVIQQQKSTQQILRQGGGAQGINPQTGSPLSMGGTQNQMIGNPTTSQPAQGLMIQTNQMAMGGGQITQNVASSTGQQNVPFKGVMGQNVPGNNMQPRMGISNIQPGMNQSPQPGGGNNMSPGMIGAPVQRAACENQLQAERQHNLEKINQLKQTLEAAQQQEQQYKSQLEIISHMKTTQLQEALQIAQQTEMQYKMLDQQRMANQGNPQAGNSQQQQGQQRMMRPVMSNNPGLRHLLQQQPQYRQQQIIGIQQQMGGNGPRPPQLGQQMPNPGAGTFDDVPNFDFM